MTKPSRGARRLSARLDDVHETPTARWRALGALLRPDARRWLALGALVAGGAALALTGPLIVREVVDRATAGTTSGEITELAIAFLVVALLTQLLAVIVVQFATVSAWRTTNGLRLQLTDHVLGLDHEFHRKHTPGELIQRVDGDVTAVSDFLSLVVPRALGAALLVSVVLVQDLPQGVQVGEQNRLLGALGSHHQPRERHRGKDADDGHHHQQLQQGEAARVLTAATAVPDSLYAHHV